MSSSQNSLWLRVLPLSALFYMAWSFSGVLGWAFWVANILFWLGSVLCLMTTVAYFLFKLSPPQKGVDDWKGVAVGHRGVRLEATSGIPENTLESLTYAIDNGAEAVEIDVILTKDNVPVVIHDDNITRLLNGEGFVSQMTFAELQKFTYRNAPESVRVPTLDDVLKLVDSRGKKILVEIKPIPHNTDLLCAKVAKSIQEFNLTDKTVVISFNPVALYHVRKINPELRTCLLFRHDMISVVSKSAKFAIPLPGFVPLLAGVLDWLLYTACTTFLPGFLGCSMMGPCVDYASHHFINVWTERGYVVYLWVVNDKPYRNYLLGKGCSVAFDFFN